MEPKKKFSVEDYNMEYQESLQQFQVNKSEFYDCPRNMPVDKITLFNPQTGGERNFFFKICATDGHGNPNYYDYMSYDNNDDICFRIQWQR